VQHAISIDVEDYRQILAIRFAGEPGSVSHMWERDMDAALALLDAAGTRAVFFVMGTIARERPDLLRRWADLGHESACHGYSHRPIWTLTVEAFRDDLQRAKRSVEDAIGCAVRGYRAPEFSVRWDTLWSLEVICECGFSYDSSIVPARTRRYGVSDFDPRPARYVLPSGAELVELPLPVANVCGRTVPIGGGGYFRLFSLSRVRRAVAEYDRQGLPFIVYCHPDELGGQRFRWECQGWRWRDRLRARLIAVKSNIGRRKVADMLRTLLQERRFAPLGQLAESVRTDGATRVLGKAR
jgi:polysaccharide deacetylase family protein (PEP-CTERM system associated)